MVGTAFHKHHQKTAIMDDDAQTLKQEYEQTNYILKELGSGSFATVYLSISKIDADALLTDHAQSTQTRSNRASILDKLRAKVHAVKVRKSDNDEALDAEVSLLTHIGKYKHPNIVRLIDTDAGPLSKAWYTMAACNAGTLEHLLGRWPYPSQQPPAAFAWHICAQLAAVILSLHVGTRGDRTVQHWTPIAHGDLYACNVLFSMSSDPEERYKDYPNLVLADFGLALLFPETPDTDDRTRAKFVRQQVGDLRNVVTQLQPLNERLSNDEIGDALDIVDASAILPRGATINERARRALRHLVRTATTKREELYEPLNDEFTAYFNKSIVSDEELEAAFPQLRNQELPFPRRSRRISERTPEPVDEADVGVDHVDRPRKRRRCSCCIIL